MNKSQCIAVWGGIVKQTKAKPGGGWIKQIPKSRYREDQLIYEMFFASRTQPGVFLEIGGYDGLGESNSIFFERCLGWHGMLVEANPLAFDLLVKNRPSAHNLLMAPSCLSSEHPVRILAYGSTNAAITDYASKGSNLVHCGPLGPQLLRINMTRINFFSLDVENHELDVLRTIDFTQIHIDVIMVESQNANNRGGNSRANVKIREYMAARGYRAILNKIKASDVFVLTSQH